MPPITPPTPPPDMYTAIVEYSVIAAPTTKWRNSYDFHSAVTPTGTADIVAALASFGPAMIFANNQLDKIKVYNWSRGTQPYPDGLPILEIPYGTAGTAESEWVFTGSQPEAGNEVCLRVDKQHLGIGRPGRFFYRNFIPYSQLQAQDGAGWSLVSLTPINQGRLEVILTSTGIVNYMAGHVDPTLQQGFTTVQYSRKANLVHGWNYDSNWVIVDVTTNKPTRKSKK